MILSVAFNLCNDFDPAIQLIASEDNLFSSNVLQMIEEYSSNEDFLLHAALLNVELLTDKKAKNLPDTAALTLLKVEDESVLERLFSLIETFPEQEIPFTKDRNNFQRLLDRSLEYIDQDGEESISFKSVIAVMGNISSHEEFSEMIQISNDDEIFKSIIGNCVKSDDKLKVAIGSCLLGNLSVSAEKVAKLVEIVPFLIPHMMSVYNKMNSPFELQSTHLIKNLILTGHNVSEVLNSGGVDLVKKLLDIKIFPVIRVMGVQIARSLSSSAGIDDRNKLIEEILRIAKVEDDRNVQLEIDNALIVAAERHFEDDPSDSAISRGIVEQLLEDCIRESKLWTVTSSESSSSSSLITMTNASQTPDSGSSKEQKSPLLLRITRVLGVVSSKSQSTELFTTDINLPLAEKLLQFAIDLDNTSNTEKDPIEKGIINNISFISVALRTSPDLSDLSTELLRITAHQTSVNGRAILSEANIN